MVAVRNEGVASPKKGSGKRNNEEERNQGWLIEWSMLAWFHDRLGILRRVSDYLYAIPNGGKRSITEAVRLKKAGVKAGVHDLHLPVPMVHAGELVPGLWVEMKAKGGKMTDDQVEWYDKMTGQGFICTMAIGWQSAAETISSYLGGVVTKSGQPLRVY